MNVTMTFYFIYTFIEYIECFSFFLFSFSKNGVPFLANHNIIFNKIIKIMNSINRNLVVQPAFIINERNAGQMLQLFFT